MVGPSNSAGEKTDALSQQQQGNFGGGANAFWDFVFFLGGKIRKKKRKSINQFRREGNLRQAKDN